MKFSCQWGQSFWCSESFALVFWASFLETVAIELFYGLEALLESLAIFTEVDLDITTCEETDTFGIQFEGDLDFVHNPVVRGGLKHDSVGEVLWTEAA